MKVLEEYDMNYINSANWSLGRITNYYYLLINVENYFFVIYLLLCVILKQENDHHFLCVSAKFCFCLR